jgi:TRAP-type C4-dicarboxylate transport system substrate-binding protein
VPVSGITSVGFAFKSYDDVWKAMDGDLGTHIRAEIAKTPIFTVSKIWDNGFRHVTSSTREIKTATDLKGFKIRVPPAPPVTSLFTALEASPSPINFNELYTALQTKVVEGQENPLAITATARLDKSANDQRDDIAKLSGSLTADLKAKSMNFLTVPQEDFRKKLASTNFYTEWKGKHGPAAWEPLEKVSGKLG